MYTSSNSRSADTRDNSAVHIQRSRDRYDPENNYSNRRDDFPNSLTTGQNSNSSSSHGGYYSDHLYNAEQQNGRVDDVNGYHSGRGGAHSHAYAHHDSSSNANAHHDANSNAYAHRDAGDPMFGRDLQSNMIGMNLHDYSDGQTYGQIDQYRGAQNDQYYGSEMMMRGQSGGGNYGQSKGSGSARPSIAALMGGAGGEVCENMEYRSARNPERAPSSRPSIAVIASTNNGAAVRGQNAARCVCMFVCVCI
jgi:hypothetical protein